MGHHIGHDTVAGKGRGGGGGEQYRCVYNFYV